MIDAAGAHGRPGLPIAELCASALSVRFGGLAALEGVDLSLRRGEILGLIGPNGAGKTTLVNCLTGFQKPSSGRIDVAGSDAGDWSPRRFRRGGVARTFQGGRLFRHLSVLENVEVTAVALGLARKPASERARDMLESLGIAHLAERTAAALPYTDERRVAIGRALVVPPAFLLLDEPAAGMTDAECDDLIAFVARIPERFGCGVLLIEHNMRVIMGACHRILVLDGGRTIARGSPTEIQGNADVIAAYLGAG